MAAPVRIQHPKSTLPKVLFPDLFFVSTDKRIANQSLALLWPELIVPRGLKTGRYNGGIDNPNQLDSKEPRLDAQMPDLDKCQVVTPGKLLYQYRPQYSDDEKLMRIFLAPTWYTWVDELFYHAIKSLPVLGPGGRLVWYQESQYTPIVAQFINCITVGLVAPIQLKRGNDQLAHIIAAMPSVTISISASGSGDTGTLL